MAHTKSFPICSVFTSCFLVMATNSGDSSASLFRPFPAGHHLTTELCSKLVLCHRQRPCRKHLFYCCGSTLVAEMCSPCCCIATTMARNTENTAFNSSSNVVLQLFPWEPACLWRCYSAMAAYTCSLRIHCQAANAVSELFLSTGCFSGSTVCFEKMCHSTTLASEKYNLYQSDL
jgi:hypothetical protein